MSVNAEVVQKRIIKVELPEDIAEGLLYLLTNGVTLATVNRLGLGEVSSALRGLNVDYDKFVYTNPFKQFAALTKQD